MKDLGIIAKMMCEKNNDFSSIVAWKAFERLALPQFLKKMEQILAEAVELKVDKAVLSCLEIFYIAYEDDREYFLKMIQDLYWKICDYRSSISASDLQMKMPESRKFIIQTVSNLWMPTPINKYNKELFNFLICLYVCIDTLMGNSSKMFWESEGAFKARKNGRIIFEGEKEFIKHTLRKRLEVISFQSIEAWMKEDAYLPSEIAKIFGIAWARNGGYIELMKK